MQPHAATYAYSDCLPELAAPGDASSSLLLSTMAGAETTRSATEQPDVGMDPSLAAPAGLPAAQPAKSSAAQPAFQPEDAEETDFLKSFAFRRPDGEPQRLGVKMLRRYVDNVPPKGSKEGQTFQQIKEYCKTAWHDMQTDGIWAEDFWAFDRLEPHELIAINYVCL